MRRDALIWISSKMISDKTAAVYFEMPGYLGVLEENAEEICTIAGNCGAVNIVGVDPISLGIVAPPMSYGADIVVGELQPLGIHMLCGGGQAGILAYKDDEVYAAECPLECYTIAPTTEEGVYGYTEIYAEKTLTAPEIREKTLQARLRACGR